MISGRRDSADSTSDERAGNTHQTKDRQHTSGKGQTTHIRQRTDNTHQAKDRQHTSGKGQTTHIRQRTGNTHQAKDRQHVRATDDRISYKKLTGAGIRPGRQKQPFYRINAE